MAGFRAALGFWGLGLLACSTPPSAFSSSGAFAAAGAAELDAGKQTRAAGAGGASASAPASAGDALAGADAVAADDSPGAAGFCTGQAVTVADLASGSVRAGKLVLLPQLVASSQKFLLSAAKSSGKCLWAAFAAGAGTSGENSGVLLLSETDGVATADAGAPDCEPGEDSLPNDLAPGDSIAAFGTFSEYAPSTCHGTRPMRELMIKPGCKVARNAPGGELPPAVTLTPALADELALGKDEALLRAWSGARVALADLNALPVDGAPGSVDRFGVIRFQETKLELHSKIPYQDLSAGGPHQPDKALGFAYPAHFERVAGVLSLDYCTWSLEVCDRCLDLSPQSRGCGPSGG